MPFKVEVLGMVRVGGKTVKTPLLVVPGIVTGIAYTAGDAFGDKFEIPVPLSGIIHTAVFLDKDDEGLETDVVLFTGDFTATADNAAFTVADADFHNFLSTITFAAFKNFAVNQVSSAAALGIAYVAPQGKLWAQMVARGAPNIAAGAAPMLSLTIIADE